MKTNNNCTCIIGSKDNKCIVHGLIGGSDVGGEVLRVYPGRENEMINDLEFLTTKTPEQEIKELEEVILNQQEKIVELTKQNKILNQQLFGHLKSTNY